MPYTNQLFTNDAVYQFRAVDIAGNESYATITKDSVLPVIEIYAEDTLLNSNALTNASSIKVRATDELSGIREVSVKLPNGTAFTKYNETSIQFSESGKYEIFATDRSGNVSEIVAITVDNIPPVVSVTHEGTDLSDRARYGTAKHGTPAT